jgi:ArsR family metal-binding transcriptional regulator
MRTKELVELNEGIKYFKDSKKVYNYIEKIDKRINSVQGMDASQKKKLEDYVDKLKTLAEKLGEIEDKFATATEASEKLSIKNEYRKIKLQNMSLFKELEKEDLKRILIGSGAIFGVIAVLSLLGGVSAFFGGGASGTQSFLNSNGKIDNSNIGNVVQNADAIKNELTKRADDASRQIGDLTYQRDISKVQLHNIDELIDKAKNVNKVGLFGFNNLLGFL